MVEEEMVFEACGATSSAASISIDSISGANPIPSCCLRIRIRRGLVGPA